MSFANAKAYNIDDDVCENEEYIAFIKDISKEIEQIVYDTVTNSGDYSYEQSLKDLLIQRTNMSETEINNMFALSASLSGVRAIEESVVEEYEQAFVGLVDESGLSEDNKLCVKSVGSIAIRSNCYWYAEE